MKKYTKNYLKHYGIAEDEPIICEVCGKIAVDIHHIVDRSDKVENLIALCRPCHERAHSTKKPRNKEGLLEKLNCG